MRLEFIAKAGGIDTKVEINAGDLLRVVAPSYAQLTNVAAAAQALANALSLSFEIVHDQPKAEAPEVKPAPEKADVSPGEEADEIPWGS